MVHAGKLMLTVVGGGAMLGSLLGSFANPVMKPGPEAPWGNAFDGPIISGASTGYIESLPENLTPPTVPDSYVPAIAFTELPPVDAYLDPFPEYDSESYADWAEGPRDPGATLALMEEPAPSVRQGVRVDFVQVAESAAAAETAAEDAALAAPPTSEAPPEDAPLAPLY